MTFSGYSSELTIERIGARRYGNFKLPETTPAWFGACARASDTVSRRRARGVRSRATADGDRVTQRVLHGEGQGAAAENRAQVRRRGGAGADCRVCRRSSDRNGARGPCFTRRQVLSE